MSLVVYVDDVYRVVRRGDERAVTADRAFLLFVCEVAASFDRLVLVGRTVADGSRGDYELPAAIELVPLPYYRSLADLSGVVRAVGGSARAFWRAAGRGEVVWAFGPHPLQLLLVAIALLRRRRVVLGVRQDTIQYFRARPLGAHRSATLAAASLLDGLHRLLARRIPTTVVGDTLAARYPTPHVLPMTVTLVREGDRAARARAGEERDGVELLTVSRLDREKNPLLLVDVLAALERDQPGRFRLTWVGRGPLEDAVRKRAGELGLAERLDLRGYVPQGRELLGLYRRADVFVHVSLTEGVPQVLIEALASATPVVATDVGGVRAAVGNGEAALLVPPNDPDALAAAIRRLTDDGELARTLATRGLDLTAKLTLEAEAARVAAFVGGGDGSRG